MFYNKKCPSKMNNFIYFNSERGITLIRNVSSREDL